MHTCKCGLHCTSPQRTDHQATTNHTCKQAPSLGSRCNGLQPCQVTTSCSWATISVCCCGRCCLGNGDVPVVLASVHCKGSTQQQHTGIHVSAKQRGCNTTLNRLQGSRVEAYLTNIPGVTPCNSRSACDRHRVCALTCVLAQLLLNAQQLVVLGQTLRPGGRGTAWHHRDAPAVNYLPSMVCRACANAWAGPCALQVHHTHHGKVLFHSPCTNKPDDRGWVAAAAADCNI
jgi:hypothetical protein